MIRFHKVSIYKLYGSLQLYSSIKPEPRWKRQISQPIWNQCRKHSIESHPNFSNHPEFPQSTVKKILKGLISQNKLRKK